MKVVITGSNGFLGQHLTNFLSIAKLDIIAISRGANQNKITKDLHYVSLDLTKKEDVWVLIESIKPDVIIHNAAMSKPDACHFDHDGCLLQNVSTTEYLLEAAARINAYFLYISTDFIYGENGPHAETDIPNPLNFYGASKLMAEQLVAKSGLDYSIVRPVFIYGPVYENMRPSFLQWVKNNLEQGKTIQVVNDQLRTPTYVFDICKGIFTILEKRIISDFNLAGKDRLSPYQMAIMVAQICSLDKNLITPVTSETFPEPVKRAKISGLKIEKAQTFLGYQPISFEDGVKLSLIN